MVSPPLARGGEPLGQGQRVVGVLGQQREQTGFQESAQEASC